jgi:hypothetical protein
MMPPATLFERSLAMRLFASSVLLLAALCIGTPAFAGFSSTNNNFGQAPSPKSPVFVGSPQSVPQPRSPVFLETTGPTFTWSSDEAFDRIRDSRRAGQISRAEARQLRREVQVIERHAEIYGRDGLSESERNELHARTLYLMGLANAPNGPGK